MKNTKVQRAILGRIENIGLQMPGSMQRALLEKILGIIEIFASKYRAAKAGHISAKGNGGKKINGEKRKHWPPNVLGKKRKHWSPNVFFWKFIK